MKKSIIAVIFFISSIYSFSQVTDTGDKVGIGIATPNEKLDVRGNISFGTNGDQKLLRVNGEIAGDDLILLNGQGSYHQRLKLIDGNSLGQLGFAFETTIDGGSNWNRDFLIQGGNVGIGGINSIAKLNVKSTSGLSLLSTGNIEFRGNSLNSGDALAIIRAYNHSPDPNAFLLKVGTTGASNWEKFIIKASGEVGIGTISPREKIDIRGNISFGSNGDQKILRVGGEIAGDDLVILNGQGSYNQRIKLIDGNTTNQHGFAFETTIDGGSNWNRDFVIKGGNVGIGTSNPQSLLAVNGVITSKEVQVTIEGWSDFVFNKDYELKDLAEVESFIEENNHLPDIPSEKEVLENGIQVGEMNARLLQKIEELTLYMIEQNKKTDKLVEEVQGLKSENELLKKEIYILKTQ